MHLVQKGLSFSSVKNDAFHLYHTLNGWAKPPDPQRLRTKILPIIYDIVNEDIKKRIFNTVKFFTITTDAWTDAQLRKYITITYHWVDDDLELKSMCGDVIPVAKAHTWDVVCSALSKRIQSEVHPDSVLVATVTDNGSNFVKVIGFLLP